MKVEEFESYGAMFYSLASSKTSKKNYKNHTEYEYNESKIEVKKYKREAIYHLITFQTYN